MIERFLQLESERTQLMPKVVIQRRKRNWYPPEVLPAAKFMCTFYST